MSRRISTLIVLVVLGVLAATTVGAEVIVERSTERVDFTRDRLLPGHDIGGFFAPPSTEKGVALSFTALLPFVIDDTAPGGTVTLLSVRHATDLATPTGVTIDYYDTSFSLITSESFSLAQNELASRNLKLVPGLPTASAVTRGTAIVRSDAEVLVDFFQLDDDGNFATGNYAASIEDSCDDALLRFLRFGADDLEGSKITFLIDGPQGGDPMDPPTVTGEVYGEAGDFLNSFTIRTSAWAFEVAATDLVIGSDFGTMRLAIDAQFSGGLVFVVHSAFGRFSVGLPAECLTPDMIMI